MVFFASEESKYITGQIITVDGGRECRLPTVVPILTDESNQIKEILTPKEMLQRITDQG